MKRPITSYTKQFEECDSDAEGEEDMEMADIWSTCPTSKFVQRKNYLRLKFLQRKLQILSRWDVLKINNNNINNNNKRWTIWLLRAVYNALWFLLRVVTILHRGSRRAHIFLLIAVKHSNQNI